MISGQILCYAVGPFDEGDAVHAEKFVETQIGEFFRPTETVSVAMSDGERGRVFMDQCEGRTVNDFIQHTEGFADGLYKASFTGSQVTHQRDDITRTQRRSEHPPGLFRIAFGLPENFPHDRNALSWGQRQRLTI